MGRSTRPPLRAVPPPPSLPGFYAAWLARLGRRVVECVPLGALDHDHAAIAARAAEALDGSEPVAVVTIRSYVRRALGATLRATRPTHVFDTSGVYLPSVPWQTLVLLGGAPVGDTIRVVRGLRGESEAGYDHPERSPVWQDFLACWDRPAPYCTFAFDVADAPAAGPAWWTYVLDPEEVARLDGTAADVRRERDALRAEVRRLRKLLWCAAHVADPAALARVRPADLEAWLVARGWTFREPFGGVAIYVHPRHRARPPRVLFELVHAPRLVAADDYGMAVGRALHAALAIEGAALPAFEALAAMLPDEGPWNTEADRA